MSESELLPCPFCGGNPYLRHQSGRDYVVCQTIICPLYESQIHAGKWNTRADKAAPVGDVDSMVAAYEKERAQYVGGVVYYPNNEEAFRGAMRKALASQPKQSEPVERIDGLADALLQQETTPVLSNARSGRSVSIDQFSFDIIKRAARGYLALQGGE